MTYHTYRFAVAALLLAGMNSVTAIAGPPAPPFTLSMPGVERKELKACQMDPDFKVRMDICGKLLKSASTPNLRVAFHLYLSTAHGQAGNYAEAIRHADDAELIERSYTTIAQRCWVRSIANVELDVGRQACLDAYAINGVSGNLLENDALISLHEGNFPRAAKQYSVASSLAHPNSEKLPQYIYGSFLALSGATKTEVEFSDTYVEQAEEALKKLSPDQRDKAVKYFASFGVTQERVMREAGSTAAAKKR